MTSSRALEIVPESAARDVISMDVAIRLIEGMFADLARGGCEVFPVVQARGAQPGSRFGVKSGSLRSGELLGLKVGSYWPTNTQRGLPNHGSTTMLLDAQTGFPRALVAASYLNRLRTAAADGVAIKHLARAQASTVGLIGAGHQAWYELVAACQVRPVREVRVWNRDPARAEALLAKARRELKIGAGLASLEEASGSDIVITCTASTAPLVRREWIHSGTHVSAMGADGRGKQELDVALVSAASLFSDVASQSITLGEFERAYEARAILGESITEIGDVILGRAPGRVSEEQITIFDSSGIALQDLTIAQATLDAARKAGLVRSVEFL